MLACWYADICLRVLSTQYPGVHVFTSALLSLLLLLVLHSLLLTYSLAFIGIGSNLKIPQQDIKKFRLQIFLVWSNQMVIPVICAKLCFQFNNAKWPTMRRLCVRILTKPRNKIRNVIFLTAAVHMIASDVRNVRKQNCLS